MVIYWNVSNPALFPTLIHSFESRALQGVNHSNVTPLGSLSLDRLRDRGKPEVPPKWRIHLEFPASFKDKERCRLFQDKHLKQGRNQTRRRSLSAGPNAVNAGRCDLGTGNKTAGAHFPHDGGPNIFFQRPDFCSVLTVLSPCQWAVLQLL